MSCQDIKNVENDIKNTLKSLGSERAADLVKKVEFAEEFLFKFIKKEFNVSIEDEK